MNVLHNQSYPHAHTHYYAHNHSAESSAAFSQVTEIKECIRCLEKAKKEEFLYDKKEKRTIDAELESDKKLLEQVQAGLVQVEVAKRTNEAMTQQLALLIKTQVAESVTSAMQGCIKQITAIVTQRVEGAMKTAANDLKDQLKNELQQVLDEFALSMRTQLIQLDPTSQEQHE